MLKKILLAILLVILIIVLTYQTYFNILNGPKIYPVKTISAPYSALIGFSPDNKSLYTFSSRESLTMINLSNDSLIRLPLTENISDLTIPLINRKFLYLSTFNETIRWINTSQQSAVKTFWRNSSTIVVLDTSNNSIIAKIPIEKEIDDIAEGPNGLLYAISSNQTSYNSTTERWVYGNSILTVINSSNNKIISTTILNISLSDDAKLFFGPDKRFMYIYHDILNTNTYVFNTTTNMVVKTINGTFDAMVVSPDKRYIYAGTFPSAKIDVLNPLTNNITETIPIDSAIYHFVLPSNNLIYIAMWNKNQTLIINTLTNNIIGTVGSYEPQAIFLSADGKYAYIDGGLHLDSLRDGTSEEIILDTSSNKVASRFFLSDISDCSSPFYDVNGKYAYGSCIGEGIRVYDIDPNTINLYTYANCTLEILLVIGILLILRYRKKKL